MEQKVDVEKIMKGIKLKAREREIADDLKMLDRIELLDLQPFESSKSHEQSDRLGESLYLELRDLKSHRRGLVGKVFGKIISKVLGAVRIFITPVIRKQEEFNRRQNDLNLSLKKDMRLQADRLSDLEKLKILDIDYLKFENQFVEEKQNLNDIYSKYLAFFENRRKVLDVGCAKGDFLSMLASVDSKGIGVEIDSALAMMCKKRGFNVVKQDVLSYFRELLKSGETNVFDGVFARQVIEHFDIYYLNDFLKMAFKLMEDDSFIVLETVNIKSLSVFTNSLYLDPTHKTAVHPQTLKFLLENAGFKNVEFIFSGEFDEKTKLEKVDSNTEKDDLYNRNIEKLNELLFAPQDYAAIAKK